MLLNYDFGLELRSAKRSIIIMLVMYLLVDITESPMEPKIYGNVLILILSLSNARF